MESQIVDKCREPQGGRHDPSRLPFRPHRQGHPSRHPFRAHTDFAVGHARTFQFPDVPASFLRRKRRSVFAPGVDMESGRTCAFHLSPSMLWGLIGKPSSRNLTKSIVTLPASPSKIYRAGSGSSGHRRQNRVLRSGKILGSGGLKSLGGAGQQLRSR